MFKPLLMLLFIGIYTIQAQSFELQILRHRDQYKKDFLKESKSPLTAEDLPFLDFFDPDSKYNVEARFEPIVDTEGFDMMTYSGKTKKYYKVGRLHFYLQNKHLTLFAYQSDALLKTGTHDDHLFVPFKDETNYTESYGGGRYIDLSTKEIIRGKIIIDFNKCYNPYCAYNTGYACPVPPRENHLSACILAGEKKFTKNLSEH